MQAITFGERGREPGKFEINYGVAVSADNEIFVTDLFNRRVQIFSMNGTYLRLFPTAVPGERRIMYPFSVAIDVEPGYLWVVGSRAPYHPDAHAIQYSQGGLPIEKFDLRFMNLNPHPSIAIDVRNNDVIVGEGDTMMMFQPNGSPFRSFEVLKNRKWSGEKIGGVVSDREGNILLTDSYKTVRVYNRFGDKILEFGNFGRDEDQLVVPHGVCVDQLGRIIVANWGKNRVDMFTSRGEFVRTVASIENPWGVTIGPEGQLVVTSAHETVTIFPRHVVFP
ncbi:protein brain tumor-like [Branchiostoma floridae x Branchiostoma japonicum]